jgi:hypothetical protein
VLLYALIRIFIKKYLKSWSQNHLVNVH